MINDIMLYIGSIVSILWGIAHIIPTKFVVTDFGQISEDNKRIITMEWIAEGLTLCFIGVLVLSITILHGSQNPVSLNVYRISAVILVIMAGHYGRIDSIDWSKNIYCADKDLSICKDGCGHIIFLGKCVMKKT
ncbi:MAG: hypothetical protein HY761_09635 [Candidatus Omnitrophica bacterium]|nr:hypothetical protein [Candidatus Omnitrophota bacterium]